MGAEADSMVNSTRPRTDWTDWTAGLGWDAGALSRRARGRLRALGLRRGSDRAGGSMRIRPTL